MGVSQTLRRWIEGAAYIWQGDHHVGHWPTFLVFYSSTTSLKGRNIASCMSTPDASTHHENEASLILSAGSRYLEKSHYKRIRRVVCNQWYFMLCAGNEWTARSRVSASCRFAVYHSNDLLCICCHSSRTCKSFYMVIPRKSWSNRCWYCRHLYQVRKQACLASRLSLSFVHLALSFVHGAKVNQCFSCGAA